MPVTTIGTLGAAVRRSLTINPRRAVNEPTTFGAGLHARDEARTRAVVERRDDVVARERQRDRADLAAMGLQEGERGGELCSAKRVVQLPVLREPRAAAAHERDRRLARTAVVDDDEPRRLLPQAGCDDVDVARVELCGR